MFPASLRQGGREMGPLNRRVALAIFALIVVSAPLAFGAGDRIVQATLVLLLGIGTLCMPPQWAQPNVWVKRLALALIALVLAKEFAPAALFGTMDWRAILTDSFGLRFPWTHNPEPARVLDAILALLVGAVWFTWVRTLASEPKDRSLVAWILFAASIVLAVVCFTMPGQGTGSIYGVRPMSGWSGFGPFPNRNHTACFLAMGAVVGCGCAVRAARRRQLLWVLLALVGLGTVFVALIASKSRGGLIACLAGLGLYALLALSRSQNRKTVGVVCAAGLVATALFLSFGAKVWSRFDSRLEGDIPTNLRWGVWHDTLGMWRDAPLFGHGSGTFAQLFPVYQKIVLENQVVLHPESSWLKWLVEMGLLTVLLAAGAGIAFYGTHLREAFRTKSGFMLRAGGFAGFAVLMIHALYDVPAHRWATAGFGLAALAMACPVPAGDNRRTIPRSGGLVLLAVAAFWMLPVFTGAPSWSPERLNQTLAQLEAAPNVARYEQLEQLSRMFPLDPELHQALGLRLARVRPSEAWRHFRAVDQLRPSSWTLPAAQAYVSRTVSAGMTLFYWTLAVERAGHRQEEVFGMAIRYTLALPTAASFWARYANTHPELLLVYAIEQSDADARSYFQQWWETRALKAELRPEEVQLFYRNLPRWGTKEHLAQWRQHYAEREPRDFKTWAALLHGWGEDVDAWQLLTRHVEDPAFPPQQLSTRLEQLEAGWLKDAKNFVLAQALAAAWHSRGELDREQKVLLSVAAQDNPPIWFLRKAAYWHAAQGAFPEAVALLLREK
jgi:O-antigen ligase